MRLARVFRRWTVRTSNCAPWHGRLARVRPSSTIALVIPIRTALYAPFLNALQRIRTTACRITLPLTAELLNLAHNNTEIQDIDRAVILAFARDTTSNDVTRQLQKTQFVADLKALE